MHQLEPLVRSQEGDALADALAGAEVSSLCGCGQSDCLSFSTRASASAVIDDTIEVDAAPAFVTLDVGEKRELLGVEILGWGALRPSYVAFRERLRTWQ